MAGSNPVDDVIEFLRRNKFTKAEAALRTELGTRPSSNGTLGKLKGNEKELRSGSGEEVKRAKESEEDMSTKESCCSVEVVKDLNGPEASRELIVREVECGSGGNGSTINWKTRGVIGEQRMVDASVGTSDNDFTLLQSSEDTVLDLYSSKYGNGNGQVKDNVKSLENGILFGEDKLAWPVAANNVFGPSTSENWKDCSVETVFPLSGVGTSSGCDHASFVDKKEGRRKKEVAEIIHEVKDQMGESGSVLEFHRVPDYRKDELPRLAPVRLKTEDKAVRIHWEEKYDRNSDHPYGIRPFLDMPFGEDVNISGDSFGFPNEYWDSDEYEDDDDVGYTRQPIEDEALFLSHEIDYPSDNEKGATGSRGFPDLPEKDRNKNNENKESIIEGGSYLSGERYFQLTSVDPVLSSGNNGDLYETEIYHRNDGRLMDEEELNLICSEPAWQGFLAQTDELLLGNGKVIGEYGMTRMEDVGADDDQHGSVRSIGVGINSDAADVGSEARESLAGDIDYFRDHDARIGGSRRSLHDNNKIKRHSSDIYMVNNDKGVSAQSAGCTIEGFSFPPPRDGQWAETCSGKSSLSNKVNNVVVDEADNDVVTSKRDKKNEFLLPKSSRDESYANGGESGNSSASSISNSSCAEREYIKKEHRESEDAVRNEYSEALLEDEETAAVQEQVKQIKAQEEDFETFNLKIVHRKNRTGFEEDKNFHCNLNSVIAGRYHVTEYLGSAAFSKAIQAHDLHTGMDVCVKVIKNNKDFFDQSLDEIKLLKYVNKHDPADKYHLLRLYDYFYYREHLLIVCELLKANLYEFQKYNRESGGEVYFTMPRLQSITIQCLEALQFLHSLGLIHCDLKPENILVKSYSRCEVKVIDLGSSCFETDNLCSYVQSRSYRAPEVILGFPYDKKIDIWSLGCILAELCTGNVLFQNDSPATLLARVIGIISPVDAEMLAKGRDVHKYFTKNHMLYERNPETNKLEYLIPKKSSLTHRLSMGDEGFIEFVAHLLQVNPRKRPSASEALKHPWLQYHYEPLSS
ncbi:uncharacterized protein LOC127252886 [Andrographis paniculata]|uniref:uncharacterized protein LOC127252886 n=1 Tax=Andrographis paniculata TaxID=175694 RepID=UPI0021E8CAFC|nr:uncharacterized protein LOC127252886 [Andrographis paniculata]XP_051133216.1 uncharacterized protein LOC127252886 [Andrographis paniculata]